jgi:hypothetical protein
VDVLMRAYFKQLHPCQPPVTIRFLSEAETWALLTTDATR